MTPLGKELDKQRVEIRNIWFTWADKWTGQTEILTDSSKTDIDSMCTFTLQWLNVTRGLKLNK